LIEGEKSMAFDPTSYREAFFAEAYEHLAALEAALMKLESPNPDSEAVHEAFRAAHSIKGGADAVGYPAVAGYVHILEELLTGYRESMTPIPSEVVNILLESKDLLHESLERSRTNQPISPQALLMVERLKNLHETRTMGAKQANNPAKTEVPRASTLYHIGLTPEPDALRVGLDPLLLLRDLETKGKIIKIETKWNQLPDLANLEPDRCYASWDILLESSEPKSVLTQTFEFAEPNIRYSIDQIDAATSMPVAAPAIVSCPWVDPVKFALSLHRKGILAAEKSLEVMQHQQLQRPKIGELAVQHGYMTEKQVSDAILQKSAVERFGETAIRMGYLTEERVAKLLLQQSRQTPPMQEVILSLNLLTKPVIDQAAESLRIEGFPKSIHMPFDPGPPKQSNSLFLDPDIKSLGDNADLITEFCIEATEHLEASDLHLLTLDHDPTNSEALNAVYRAFHTIKGGSSMLDLNRIRKVAHEAENLLNLARDGKITLKGNALDLAFASVDALKKQVGVVRNWVSDLRPMGEDPTLVHLVEALKREVAGETAKSAESKPLASLLTLSAPAELKPSQEASKSVEFIPPVVMEPAASEPAQSERAAPAASRPQGNSDRETVRVDRDRLDKLINTIGELVIARSMAEQEFDQLTGMSSDRSVALTELSKISKDLQEISLSLRMVPMQGTFQKMARLVRDLSRKMNKPVELELEGEETELDKTMVDHLGDPLMHMVRNAIDHGLESSIADRSAVGKPATGKVKLKAYHQSGSVLIELTDDGKGLNRDVILKKAIEKGIVPESARLSDPEIYALIFQPGFSTAKAVTDVSGRGVGMDVVRRNVEALHGNILIDTVLGKGTTFTIRLPLTLAIMDGLVVGVGEDVYVLPILSVVESFQPQPKDINRIAGRGEVVNVRGETVPLIRLYQLLGRPNRVSDPSSGLLVLVEDRGNRYAILVDELLGQMQAVVKSLDSNYTRVEGVAGATILGNGTVALILDVHGLTRLYYQDGNRHIVPSSQMDMLNKPLKILTEESV
jgi:two-component system, chemotaxis family, sensor kinase CheA